VLDQKVELLQSVPLFEGLDADQIAVFAAAGQKVFFEAGQTIIAQGEQGESAYLIITGKAVCTAVEQGETHDRDLWPGTFLGELAMLVETEFAITATAKERTRALAFNRESVRAVLEEHPDIAQHFADKLLTRLQGLASELKALDERLAEMEAAA
jgi:CRP-like cAMP-binding protein